MDYFDCDFFPHAFNFPEKLGSFTATLEWDVRILHFEEYHGGTAKGFESPVVNTSEVKNGKLRFANSYPYGANGVANILNVQFKVRKSSLLNELLRRVLQFL